MATTSIEVSCGCGCKERVKTNKTWTIKITQGSGPRAITEYAASWECAARIAGQLQRILQEQREDRERSLA